MGTTDNFFIHIGLQISMNVTTLVLTVLREAYVSTVLEAMTVLVHLAITSAMNHMNVLVR